MLPKFLKPYHIKSSNLVRIGPKTDGGYIIDKRILNKINILITILPDLVGHDGVISSICFSPDGNYIASSSHD